jgi:hypothetical protein
MKESKPQEKTYGKGKGPEKGRNWKNWSDGWDYWKKQESKKKKT